MLENSKERQTTAKRKAALMAQIEAYVDANLARKISLSEISTHCGVSISTITQLFQKQSNTTFHGLCTARRMARAHELIVQGVALEQVGRDLGYQDHSTFYRAFRSQFGLSPRQYRDRLLKEEQK